MKKIQKIVATALVFTAMLALDFNYVSATDKNGIDISISNSVAGELSIVDIAFDKLESEGWTRADEHTIETNYGRFKLENLKDEDGKDAMLTIKCDDESKDSIALSAIKSMIGDQSSYSEIELGMLIANGSSTIADGTRMIDVKYDGNIDYTIEITFYKYNYVVSDYEKPVDNSKDINNDGSIDALDLSQVSSKYNISFQDEEWDDNCDINKDGIIDLFDIIELSRLIEM